MDNNKDDRKKKNNEENIRDENENGLSPSQKVQQLLKQFTQKDGNGIDTTINNIIGQIGEGTVEELEDPYSKELRRVAQNLVDINLIRAELARLDINLAERIYYDNEVFPLLNTLFFLSNASENFSSSARNLSQINFSKSSEIKDAIDLTDCVNELSKKVLRQLGRKLDVLIKIDKKS